MENTSKYCRKNNAMVDSLISINRIRTTPVERVFRAVDRGDYVTPNDRSQAYLQQPWRSGQLHLSAPCIYGEVLEGLELKPGQSFLNVGSGTGYFNTLVGLILGCSGVNHGVDVYTNVVDFANERLEHFIENSPALDEFDFCAPKFHFGNGLCLGSSQLPYDRVYCGADCPAEYLPYFKRLIKIGGVLVLPCEDRLLQIKRKSVDVWLTKSLLYVSFSTLRLPSDEETANPFTLEMPCPQRLQILSYAVVRKCMKASQMSRSPHVFEPLLRCPRLTDSDVNELLRYVLSMVQNLNHPLLLPEFSYKKQNNVGDKDGDYIKSRFARSEFLEEPEKNNASYFADRKETISINQTNENLAKTNNGVQEILFSSLLKLSQNSESDSPKDTNKTDLTLKNDPDTSIDKDKSVNIEGNKKLDDSIEVLKNKFDAIPLLIENEAKISLNNGTNCFTEVKTGDKTNTNKESKRTNRMQPFKFFAPSQYSPRPSTKFTTFDNITLSESLEKETQTDLTPPAADASESKEQPEGKSKASPENINSSPVFIFSGKQIALASKPSPLETESNACGVPQETVKPAVDNLDENVDDSTSATSHPAPEPLPADGLHSTCNPVGKDIQLSILMKQGVMEVHLPYEQKQSTNIIFTKTDDKASDDNSSRQLHSGECKMNPAQSQDKHMSNIFSRLNIILSPIPLKKVVPSRTVQISFKTLNYYTDWFWEVMMATVTQSFDDELNKAIFQKGVLLLAEAKVAYAQKKSPNEGLWSRTAFTDEQLLNLKEMASKLPLPLAIYLECLGNTKIGDQIITPVLAEHPEHKVISGAPCQMLPLFQLLRFGVPMNEEIHQLVRELGLPMLDWEEIKDTSKAANEVSFKARITQKSYDFWVTTRNGNHVIKWDAEDCCTFKKIVSSLDARQNFNVDFDLSHGLGSQAQLVRTINYKVDRSTHWLTTVPVDDISIKLGAAFAFHCPRVDQRTHHQPVTYMRGEIIPRRIMFAIFCNVFHS